MSTRTLQKPLERVPVPGDFRQRLQDLVSDIGKKRTCRVLACSEFTLADAMALGGMLRPLTLEKLQASLDSIVRGRRESP